MQVLVLCEMNIAYREQLESCQEGCEFIYNSQDQVSMAEIAAADIIIGRPKIEMLGRNAAKLKWLQLSSAGVDGYTADGVLPKGCILTNAAGAYGLAVSEHMLAQVFMLMKKLNLYFRNQQEGCWKPEGTIKSISSSVFAVVGLGNIGLDFAEKVKALGGYVIGVNRHQKEASCLDESFPLSQLDEVLPRADVLVMILPGAAETYHIIDEKRLKLLKKDAIIINGGRGTTVDLDALCQAIEQRNLSGAALDVTEPEPLPAGHRAWGIENLLITPHVAGGFYLEETFQRIVSIAAKNLEAYLKQQDMINVIEYQ